MVNPIESVGASKENGSRNGGASESVDNNASSQIDKKSGARQRFNWKNRYLTSHGSAGSEGKVS